MHVDAEGTRVAAYTQLAGTNQMGKRKEKTRKKGGVVADFSEMLASMQRLTISRIETDQHWLIGLSL
jgi:hypothetical protein